MIFNIFTPLIYVVFLLGLFMIYYEPFELLFRKIKRKSLLKHGAGSTVSEKRFYRYTEDMINVVIPSGRVSAANFFALSAAVFAVIFILMFPTLSFKAVIPSFFFAAMPFAFLRFRLEKLRNKGSKEAEKLVAGLLNYYRVQHKNIFSAIEAFIKDESEECEITRNLMFQLLIDVRNTKNPVIIKRAADRFAFGIRTNWSCMLGQCIFAAAYEGIDISESLEDILEQLKTARILDEEKKRANSESTRLVRFLVPFAYFASIAISVFMMDIPLKKIIYNQFTDITGVGIFFIITVLFIINSMMLDMVKNGKFDY